MVVFQRLQLMLQTPPASGDLLTQYADADSHRQMLPDVAAPHVLQQQALDSIAAGQYDGLGCEFSMQTTMVACDSEMVSTGADIGLPDFGFPPLDVTMTDDGMSMPDLLSMSTLSSDIAHLMY